MKGLSRRNPQPHQRRLAAIESRFRFYQLPRADSNPFAHMPRGTNSGGKTLAEKIDRAKFYGANPSAIAVI